MFVHDQGPALSGTPAELDYVKSQPVCGVHVYNQAGLVALSHVAKPRISGPTYLGVPLTVVTCALPRYLGRYQSLRFIRHKIWGVHSLTQKKKAPWAKFLVYTGFYLLSHIRRSQARTPLSRLLGSLVYHVMIHQSTSTRDCPRDNSVNAERMLDAVQNLANL